MMAEIGKILKCFPDWAIFLKMKINDRFGKTATKLPIRHEAAVLNMEKKVMKYI